MSSPIPSRAVVALVVAGAMAGACEREVRVIRRNPFLAGLPGAETSGEVVRDLGAHVDPGAIAQDQLVVVGEDKKKRLIAQSGHHLMIHIHNTLEDDDRALFVDQVLSQITKRECFDRTIDPGEAFEYLRRNKGEIDRLFAVMPMGERTPGLFMRPVGGGVQRVLADPALTKDLMFAGFDMVVEKGQWRLRWFIPTR